MIQRRPRLSGKRQAEGEKMKYDKEEYLINKVCQDQTIEKIGRYNRDEAKALLKGKTILEHYESPFDWDTEIVLIQE